MAPKFHPHVHVTVEITLIVNLKYIFNLLDTMQGNVYPVFFFFFFWGGGSLFFPESLGFLSRPILFLWQKNKNNVLGEKERAVVKIRHSQTKGPETKYN